MGWLRALMQSANPPLRSLDALARALTSTPSWSEATRMQARSLSAMLGKLDRDQDLDWLRHRADLQQALCQVLSCELSAVTDALSATPGRPTGPDRYIALLDVDTARPLDLLVEQLPPGIPETVLLPGTWTREWWCAHDDLALELVARWLETRGMCRTLRVFDRADLSAASSEPLLVDLRASPPGAIDALDGVRAPLCVVSPDAPPPGSGWRRIESPAPRAFVGALAAWLALRLPADGAFDPELVTEWIVRGPLAEDLVDGVESALGWMGLADRFGIAAVRNRRPFALAEHYFKTRLGATHAAKEPSFGWLRREGMAAAAGVARQLLTRAPDRWDAPRSFEQWIDLVPEEHRGGVDVEWVKVALSDRSTLRAKDVESAASRLPPGSFRVVQALTRIGVLRPWARDRFALAPRWFALTLMQRALADLLAGPPAEWGEALAGATRAAHVARHLYARARAGEPLDHVLEAEDPTDPAWVAALEGAFRALGLALLAGSEISSESLEGAWDEQLALCCTFDDGVPRPRIEFDAHDPTAAPDEAALLSRGAWILAALAISEQLAHGVGARHRALRPWIETAHDAASLHRVLDEALQTIRTTTPACEWAVGAFALVDRLSRLVGHEPDRIHPLAAPGRVVDEADHDVLEWSTVAAASTLPHAGAALELVARSRGVEWGRIAGAVWSAWVHAGAPEPGASVLDPGSPGAERFWAHVPGALVARATRCATPGALQHLDPTRWESLVRHWLENDEPLPIAAVGAIPPEALAAWLERARTSDANPETWTALWVRFPEELAAKVRRVIAAGEDRPAAALLDSAPLDATSDVVALVDWSRQRPALLHALRPTLHRRVGLRSPGWREAFALLTELETAVATARRALG